MDAGFFDMLVGHFIAAFQQGFAVLNTWAMRLFGIVGFLAWGVATLHIFASGAERITILIQLAIIVLSIAVHLLIVQNIMSLATGAFDLFVHFGALVSGWDASNFVQPSSVLTMGFRVGAPILDFLLRLGKWLTTNPVTMILMTISFLTIVIVFIWTARHVIMAILEFHLSVMVAPVLIPWALLSQTAVFAEFSIAWILSNCIRMFLISAVLGVSVPLVNQIRPLFSHGDPTLMSALLMAAASWIFFVLADKVALRAETVGGRGFALGLPGSALVPSTVQTMGSAAASYAMGGLAGAGMAAIQGVSRMMKGRKEG